MTPVDMVMQAFDGELIDLPQVKYNKCDWWVERWGQSPRRTVQGHFWPICRAVGATHDYLVLEVWSDYPRIVVPRREWKSSVPGHEVNPINAMIEEER